MLVYVGRYNGIFVPFVNIRRKTLADCVPYKNDEVYLDEEDFCLERDCWKCETNARIFEYRKLLYGTYCKIKVCHKLNFPEFEYMANVLVNCCDENLMKWYSVLKYCPQYFVETQEVYMDNYNRHCIILCDDEIICKCGKRKCRKSGDIEIPELVLEVQGLYRKYMYQELKKDEVIEIPEYLFAVDRKLQYNKICSNININMAYDNSEPVISINKVNANFARLWTECCFKYREVHYYQFGILLYKYILTSIWIFDYLSRIGIFLNGYILQILFSSRHDVTGVKHLGQSPSIYCDTL